MTAENPGKLVIITAPSGSGKTTLVHHLLKEIPQLAFSVSACTRAPRKGEVDGVHYHFLTLEIFTRKIAHHEFAEFEMVYEGKYYGTLKSELERIWNHHQVPLIDIDVYGAMRLKRHYSAQSLSLFIQAPDLPTLENRLRGRGTESEESIRERLNKAAEELRFAGQFDHLIVNDQLDRACLEAKSLIQAFLKV
jgi:guanylate kinase